MIPPCYHCPERHIGCHATCKQYLEWCKINEQVLERKRADRDARDANWESAKRAHRRRRDK